MAAGDIIVVNENTHSRKGNYFDGTDDYVLHDAHAVARVAANDTVGVYMSRIYSDNITPASDNCILSCGDNDSANEFMVLVVDTAGSLRANLTHGGAAQFTIVQTIPTMESKKWHDVAIRQNGTRPDLFIDGKPVTMTDAISTDLTFWYDELTLVDKFAIGVKESNATHTIDFKGAIGRTRYYALNMTDAEILAITQGKNLTTKFGAARAAVIETARVFDVTMEDDGITDSGSGADNGTLTGGAYYGGEISDWSYKLNANSTGHAAETINTLEVGKGNFLSVIKRGD